MAIDWDAIRAQFPVTERYVYLNHAALSPLPLAAVDRVRDLAVALAESGDELWEARLAEAERVRELAARLLGARSNHEVAFVQNTSDGLSIVAEGVDWREGDNVVGADCEFPANVYPWMNLASRGVEYRQASERDGRLAAEDLFALVDERTRVLALSWVQFASGFRSDLARIGRFCRERDVLFVVDGIQALGALDVDIEREYVDVLAADAHKWLLGPEGIGLCYVSDRVVERLRSTRAGWTAVKDWKKWTRYDLTFREGAGRFEGGTLNMLGIHALGASLEMLLEIGIADVERRMLELAERIASGLEARQFTIVSSRRDGERSGIVAATHAEQSPQRVVAKLRSADVLVAHRANRLRISPHFYNSDDDVERFFAALDA